MDKYKKIIDNSAIFIIGNFGSKLINFFMVPLYTHVLLASEYGVVDLINVTISLLLPFLTFELGKAALRFSIESSNEKEENKIFSNIIIFYTVIILVLLGISPIIIKLNLFENYGFLFILLLLFRIFNEIYTHYIRGINLIKEYAINGILMTMITVLSNVILLLIFKAGVKGYVLSMIIATLISNVYLFIVSRGFYRIRNINSDLNLFKNMLQFSLPIIPSAAIWWIINGSSRYFILFFVGSSANGLYAVASKIPSIISLVTNVFSQAWQLSSFEEFESKDREVFYSNVYNMYFSMMFFLASIIMIFLKPIVSVFVSSEYFLSWKIIPFLLLGVIYQSLSGFYGIIYQASKKTKGSLFTSIFGGIVSLITSFLLVPRLGAIGAGISTASSFYAIYLLRIWDTQNLIKIRISKRINFLTTLLLIMQIIVVFLIEGAISYLFQVILFILVLLVNRLMLLKIYNFIVRLLKQKSKNNN